VRRRELLIALGGGTAVAWPLALRAQQKTMPVIGILGASFPELPGVVRNLDAFRQALKEAGFIEGRNVAIEYRWAYQQHDRLPALAAELVARKVDVIVTEGTAPSALAAKAATATIPIVFHTGDAIAEGLVGNLAHPGGNLTGVSLFAPESLVKRFQLLSELVPDVKVIALLTAPDNISTIEQYIPYAQTAASTLGVELLVIKISDDSEMDAVYSSLGQRRAAAVVLAGASRVDRLVALAARQNVPSVYGQRAFAEGGGLISYGVSIPAAYVIKGIYTGKILKGANPADLPVEQPSKFELVVNLKTAKALGLTVPQSILARADEVIE
jgi:putative ABC transport system substrate-binding protein